MTGIHEIEIIQTKFEKVTIKYLEDDHKETWTLDNLYIFDKDHVAKIYQNAIDYGKISKVNFKDVELNTEGIYILHNDECDDKHGYFMLDKQSILFGECLLIIIKVVTRILKRQLHREVNSQ